MTRYAVYWAPEQAHPLWAAGCEWLGRDATHTGAGEPPPHRAAPWRYGFHATLKAPMALAAGVQPAALHDALGALAVRHRAFALPPLQVGTLADFIALRLPHTPPELQRLADDCVMQLDALRAAPGPDERASRAAGLDAEHAALLQRWGYPHVLQRWRFHMTLSDPLPEAALRHEIRAQAQRWFARALAQPVAVASVCLFEEASPGAPLRLTRRCALAG